MTSCCVEGCCSSKSDVTLFEFPTSRLLRKRWLDAISPSSKLPPDALVCARHFAKEDYELVRGRTRLKGRVVPAFFQQEALSPKQNDPLSENDTSQHTDKETNNVKHKRTLGNDNGKVAHDNDKSDRDNDKGGNDESKRKGVTSNGHNDKNRNDNNYNGKIGNDNDKIANDNGAACHKMVADKAVSKRVRKKFVPMRRRGKLNGDMSDDSSSQDSVNSDIPPPPILEDLEEHLPNYQIANMKTERQLAAMAETVDPVEDAPVIEEMVMEPHVPVFIELSVGQDNIPGSEEPNDCLMVLESVECDVDPTLMLEARAEDEECCEQIDLDDDDDDDDDVPPSTITVKPSVDPISLLTSSDEDDVILQEPHIDTLSVSDETDEDDLPLQKLIKKDKKTKKTKKKKKKPEAIQSILVGTADFYCYYCQFISNSRSTHEKHMKMHSKELEEQSQAKTRVYQICKECGFTTSSKSQLHRHQRKHLNEKRYKCPLCSYRSKYNMSLMYHLKTHDYDPNMYNCGACGLKLDCKKALLKHQEACCELAAKFPCDVCGFEARTKRAMKMHRNSVHKQRS